MNPAFDFLDKKSSSLKRCLFKIQRGNTRGDFICVEKNSVALGSQEIRFTESSFATPIGASHNLDDFFCQTFDLCLLELKPSLARAKEAKELNLRMRFLWCAGGDLNPYAEAYAPQTYVSTSSTTRAHSFYCILFHFGLSDASTKGIKTHLPDRYSIFTKALIPFCKSS